jgi:hypothetical protein
MADERVEVALPDLGRWLAVALLVVGGLVLYFRLAPGTHPIVDVPVETSTGFPTP